MEKILILTPKSTSDFLVIKNKLDKSDYEFEIDYLQQVYIFMDTDLQNEIVSFLQDGTGLTVRSRIVNI